MAGQLTTVILSSVSILMFAAVFISRVRHDYWIFRVLEYPRLQKLVIVAILIALWLGFFPLGGWLLKVCLALLVVSAIYLVYKVYPYTVFCPKEMKRVEGLPRDRQLKIFTANVYQDNTEYARLLSQIRSEDPDIIFLVETNAAWKKAMEELRKDYPYSHEQPQENTYGLLFFSRIPTEDAAVKFLVKDDIPSVEVSLSWQGQRIKLWGLHPEPPVPGENLYATAKDKELMKVAFKVRDCQCPAIVFGDLNDVAWSHTTELFRKTSRLLDPRIGRGFYSTFSARSWFVRFPLDYIFCSDHFQLVCMRRMPKNGSDHFATSVSLAYVPEGVNEQEAPAADAEELGEASRKAGKQPVS